MPETGRRYETSHPWLRFTLNLGGTFSVDLASIYVLLGECASKCKHLSSVPLSPKTRREYYLVCLAKGVHGTVAIEGNSMTEDQVRRAVDGDLEMPRSQDYLKIEVDNVVAIANQMARDVFVNHNLRLSVTQIHEYNRRIFEGLEVEDHVLPGRVSEVSIGVDGPGYVGAPREDCEFLLEKLVNWLETPWGLDRFGGATAEAIMKSIMGHLYLVWIHPYGDGNGRTARLLEVFLLLRGGLPQPAAHLLSNHYNLTRDWYARHLDHSSRSGGDVLPFIRYALEGLRDGLDEQLRRVHTEHLRSIWRSLVHDTLQKQSEIQARRRHLALDLVRERPPEEWSKTLSRGAMQKLSPRVIAAYATTTKRTMTRDLNALESEGLIRKVGTHYCAAIDRILDWRPSRVCDDGE